MDRQQKKNLLIQFSEFTAKLELVKMMKIKDDELIEMFLNGLDKADVQEKHQRIKKAGVDAKASGEALAKAIETIKDKPPIEITLKVPTTHKVAILAENLLQIQKYFYENKIPFKDYGKTHIWVKTAGDCTGRRFESILSLGGTKITNHDLQILRSRVVRVLSSKDEMPYYITMVEGNLLGQVVLKNEYQKHQGDKVGECKLEALPGGGKQDLHTFKKGVLNIGDVICISTGAIFTIVKVNYYEPK